MAYAHPRSPAPGRAPWRQRHEQALYGALGLLVFLGGWELLVRGGVMRATLISSPSAIADAGWALARSGTLGHDVKVTLTEFVLAFVLALVCGVAVGVVAGLSRRASYLVNPWLELLYATPLIALTPMLILWLGIGLEFKVVLGALVGTFPIAVNTRAGILSAEESLVTVPRSFGAGRIKTFTSVLMPGTVPYLFAGVHQAVGRVLVAVIVGELLASNEGLGFRMGFAGQTFNVPDLMVCVVLLAVFGIVLAHLIGVIEHRVARWRPR